MFGASLAWLLARDGVAVTLVDRFEPGDPRATSGGESRLIRCGHGPDATYTASARRARALWRELEAECGEDLMVECGLVWMAHAEDGFEAASAAAMAAQGIPCERLDPAAGDAAVPQLRRGGARLPAPRARGRRAARPARDPGAGAPCRPRTARPWSARRRPRTATASGWTTGARSRRTSSSGPAARGSAGCSPRRSRSGRPGRSCSSSPAARRGRRTACPRSSTSTTRSTARATSTGSA